MLDRPESDEVPPAEVGALEGGAAGNPPQRLAPDSLSLLKLQFDAAKHLSKTHRDAHIDRRKLELRITFGPILVLFVAAATILVRGDVLRAQSASGIVFGIVSLATVGLVAATAMYLRRMQDANVANRVLAEVAEDWLAEKSVGNDWSIAKEKRIPKRVHKLTARGWWPWQVGALVAAAVVLIGVLFIVQFQGRPLPQPPAPGSAQPAARSLSLDGGGVKLELKLGE